MTASTAFPYTGPTDATSDEVAAFRRVGLPEHAADQVTAYVIAGLTPTVVAPYLARPDQTALYYAYLPHLIEQGIPADILYAYIDAGVRDPIEALKLWRAGCAPVTAAAWLAPLNTPDQARYLVVSARSFAGAYTRAAERSDQHTDLIDAFFAAVPATPERRFLATPVADAIDDWVDLATGDLIVPVTPQRAAELFAAGITPDEVLADPRLADADAATLALLATLRG